MTIAALLALLTTAACTGGSDDGDEKPERGAAPAPKTLKPLWTVAQESSMGSGVVWVRDGIVAVYSEGGSAGLRGYDQDSGKKRWEVEPPKGTTGICGVSRSPNADGVAGVLFSTGATRTDCDRAAAVDASDGTVRWTEDLGTQADSGGTPTVSVSEETLVASGSCDEVRRFRISDGKRLPTLVPRDRACAHDSVHDGRGIAVLDDPDSSSAPEGSPRRSEFALYDPDSGKKLWHRPVAPVGSAMHRIIAHDPLTLETTEKGHRFVRTYDDKGGVRHLIGKELDMKESPGSPVTGDGVLVTSYANDPRAHAYDLRTGKELWQRDLDRATLLGVSGDRALATYTVLPQGKRQHETWLLSFGLRDGKRQVLGRMKRTGPALGTSVLADGRLYATTGAVDSGPPLSAHKVPSGGDPWRNQLPASSEPRPEWAKGDVRPAKTSLACEAVSAKTLKAMGLPGDRPPPENCHWHERFDPRDAERELEVQVEALKPEGSTGSTGSKPGGAVAAARKAFADSKHFAESERPRPVQGLGDEAKAVVYSGAPTLTSVRLLARYRNVLVMVDASTRLGSREHGGFRDVPPRQGVETAAASAAAEVLRKVDAKNPLPAAPEPGATTRITPLCEKLRADGDRLVPGAKASDQTPRSGGGRVSACEWSDGPAGASALTVRAEALTGSPLTGGSAEAAAKEAFGQRTPDSTEVDGLGRQAGVRHDSDDGERSAQLHVRQGNLLIEVGYRRAGSPGEAELDAEVKSVARRILAAHKG